jgi:sec-independent protein translocase protein TatA
MDCKCLERGYFFLATTTTNTMGPLGMPELFMIFVVILLLFGAKKLPELARGLGKSMGEFKKAKEEFESEIHQIARADTDPRVKEVAGKEPRES